MWARILPTGDVRMPIARMRVLTTMVLALLLGGCPQSPLVPCGDSMCPPGNVCTAGGCATPTDVSACDGLADGNELTRHAIRWTEVGAIET